MSKRFVPKVVTSRCVPRFAAQPVLVRPALRVSSACEFSLPGPEKVQAEWQLVCTAANLRRMSSMTTWA